MPRIAIYGDLGYQNERSLHFLEKDVQDKMYDVIFHIGDMAYNLYERNCEQGHDFMRSIEPVAATIPYMVIPGKFMLKFTLNIVLTFYIIKVTTRRKKTLLITMLVSQ